MRNEPVSTRLDPLRERELLSRAATDRAAFGELYDFYVPRLYGYIVRRIGERSIAETMTAATLNHVTVAIGSEEIAETSFGGWLYRDATTAILDYVRSRPQLIAVAPAPNSTPAPVETAPVGTPAVETPVTATGKGRARTGSTRTSVKATSAPEPIIEPTPAPVPELRPSSRTARMTGDEEALDAFADALDGNQLAHALRRVPEAHRRVLMLRFYDDLEVDEICGLLGCTRSVFSAKLNRALGAMRAALLKESTDAA